MAYIGENNLAKKVTSMYIGVDNIARKITKGYIGVNNVAQQFYSAEVGPLTINFTGDMTYADSGNYRYYTITSSGTLSYNKSFTGDIWICGGGGNGGKGNYSSTSSSCSGGGGGGGGHLAQSLSHQFSGGSVMVTVGAARGNSSFGELLTASAGSSGSSGSSTTPGAGGNGGSGGGPGRRTPSTGKKGAGDGISTKPFSDSYFTDYPCAGGAGGGSSRGGLGGNGGSDGSDGTTTYGCTGGETGGGSSSYNAAGSAATYYGSGGGGGAGGSSSAISSGSGYQGVCFLRVALTEFAA